MLYFSIVVTGWIIFFTALISLYNNKFEFLTWIFTTIILLLFTPYLWLSQQSIIQSVLAFVVSFASLYVLYTIIYYNISMTQTTIFITVSSGLLLFSYTIPTVQNLLIYNVTSETQYILELIGFNTDISESKNGMYIIFTNYDLQTEIVMACTGIGSISLFAGFISAIDSLELYIKLILIIISSMLIYLLNAVRNVFIAGAYGGQWFHIQPGLIESIFGRGDEWVSFYVADKIIAQFGAVIVMIIFSLGIISIIDNDTKFIKEWEQVYKKLF